MIYNEFKLLFKKDNIDNLYLFLGEENYLMNECIQFLKDKYIDINFETLNFSILDGESTNLEGLINACETLPFMASKKLIILKNINQFIEKEEVNSKEELYKYLESIGDHILLILMDNSNDLKKTTKLYRQLNKNNNVVEFNKLKGKDLNLWVESITMKYKKKMSISNINYFLQNSSYLSKNISINLYDLENELKKLIDYGSGVEITKSDIDDNLTKSLDNNIFDLLTSLNSGDIDSSLMIFNDIYMANEPIQKILFMIGRQIRLLLGYKLYKEKGYSEGDIMGKLQIKNYEFGKISNSARGYTIAQLENSLNEILNTDRKIKTTSSNDSIEMEMLLVNLAKKK